MVNNVDMETAPAPTASTYSEAIKISEAVTLEEAVRRLNEDDNPKIYRYRKAARIAMNLQVYTSDRGVRFTFVGFEYCNRNGFSAGGTATIHHYANGKGYTPTVFQSDWFGYFHVAI